MSSIMKNLFFYYKIIVKFMLALAFILETTLSNIYNKYF